MNWSVKGIFAILLVLFIAGCGSGGTSGRGNTVYISASTQSGTPTGAFAHYSSNGKFVGNALSYTVTSTPYSTATGITNSDVLLTSRTYQFIPLAGSVAFTPLISSKSMGFDITPGGKMDLTGDSIIQPADILSIHAAGGGYGTLQQYAVKITFIGTEVNTGTTLSTSITPALLVQMPYSSP